MPGSTPEQAASSGQSLGDVTNGSQLVPSPSRCRIG